MRAGRPRPADARAYQSQSDFLCHSILRKAKIADRGGTARRRNATTQARSRSEAMDKATIELLARRAGLDKALAEFPDDVTAAATQAGIAVARMKAPAD